MVTCRIICDTLFPAFLFIRIIILNKNKDLEPEEELVKDVLQIMNIFTAKMNGLRKYKEKD